MARQTFRVAEFKELVNNTLASTPEDAVQYRHGVIACLEFVLHDMRNYKGFRYLSEDEVPSGRPGINRLPDKRDFEARFANTDSTRRYYF